MKILALALILPILSFAGTTANNFTSTAHINNSCLISADNVSFGAVNTNVTAFANNTISVLCNKGANYTITGKPFLPDGSHHLIGTTNNTDIINYTVNLRSNFDDGFWFGAPYNNIASNGTGVLQSHILYYRARSGINKSVKADNYTDNYTLTLTY